MRGENNFFDGYSHHSHLFWIYILTTSLKSCKWLSFSSKCHTQLQIPLVALDIHIIFFCHKRHVVAPSWNGSDIKV